MNIAVVGLGLIGGSFCKTIKKKTAHTIYGIDLAKDVCEKAFKMGVVDVISHIDDLKMCDMAIICLHPEATIDFLKNNAQNFKKGSLVFDTCGVKAEIVDSAWDLLKSHDVNFLGAHPMAGREFSGFDYSTDTLFDGAYFIITPQDGGEIFVQKLSDFAHTLGFGKVVISTPAEHDEIIAFTSQLAHIVSNAYVKSPTLHKERGFTAGSFSDMTRVARLNEDMWTALFMMNKIPLEFELDNIISHLIEYRNALKNDEKEKLRQLLRHGRELKEGVF